MLIQSIILINLGYRKLLGSYLENASYSSVRFPSRFISINFDYVDQLVSIILISLFERSETLIQDTDRVST